MQTEDFREEMKGQKKRKKNHPTRDVACGFNEHGMVGYVQDASAPWVEVAIVVALLK
jgi:hypothetical protein